MLATETPAAASPEATRVGATRTARRRLVVDRVARYAVVAGGIGIIASVLGILFFIVLEIVPLLRPAKVTSGPSFVLPAEPLALLVDEYREQTAALSADGLVRAVATRDGRLAGQATLVPPGLGTFAGASTQGRPGFAAALPDGSVRVMTVAWDSAFDAEQRRSLTPRFGEAQSFLIEPAGQPLGAFAAELGEEGGVVVAAQLSSGDLAVMRAGVERNAMTGEETRSADRRVLPLAQKLTHLVLDAEGRHLFGGTAGGELLWWTLGDGELAPPQVVSAGPSPITALTLLLGGRSLVAGQQNGAVSVWLEARQEDESIRLVRARDFPRMSQPGQSPGPDQATGQSLGPDQATGQSLGPYPPAPAVVAFAASPRNKGFLAADASGRLALYHSTSERILWTGPAPLLHSTAIAYAPKADGALLAGDGRVAIVDIVNPHPELTLKALFGKIWYESYSRPELVWQSTGGSDDFEPKFSLTPLLVGTLKGTFYSLLLAIPIGVLGAMFASQFMHPRVLRVVKPTVEIMAALPSVVLGFLAGLWLAPLVERGFPGLVLMALVLPLSVLVAGYVWRALPRQVRARFATGSEVWLYAAVLALGAWACMAGSDAFGRLAFGGNFQRWLLETTGLAYDQRNAVVVGLAMGIAVIPIIFAISEDAFSNVPRNLVAGSLALGANRWQTVTRVVLPSASPGIFSAVMIGFGRAVGETMIVLMATGNTPIMSWNPFNGFRTLSANIAVEIPEAPQGGTLYRTLFLAALLLFVLTFAVNTVAEIVRQRLRRRYSEL